MREQLGLLIELSRIDDELQELMLERESLPANIAELEGRKQALRDAVTGREAEIEDAAKERRHLEGDLDDLTVKLRDLESKRLEIKTNEEYAALSLEIEHTRKSISDAEDLILRGLESAERASAELSEARLSAEEETSVLEGRIGELRSDLCRLDDAIAVKRDERLRISTRIEAHALERYERILSSKGDAAVASVVNGTCSGCRIKLPPQTVIEVKRSDRIIECQSCGRILCWIPEGGVG